MIGFRPIQRLVADYFAVPIEAMTTRWWNREYTLPRHLAMYLCRRMTKFSYPQLGRHFGGRDHATVHKGVAQIADRMAVDIEFRAVVEDIYNKLQGIEMRADLSDQMYGTTWYQSRVDRLRELYRDGTPVKEIAESLGTSLHQTEAKILALELPKRSDAQLALMKRRYAPTRVERSWSAHVESQLVVMYVDQGWPVSRIAKELARNPNAVTSKIFRMGLKRDEDPDEIEAESDGPTPCDLHLADLRLYHPGGGPA